jgi:hypothetical protein
MIRFIVSLILFVNIIHVVESLVCDLNNCTFVKLQCGQIEHFHLESDESLRNEACDTSDRITTRDHAELICQTVTGGFLVTPADNTTSTALWMQCDDTRLAPVQTLCGDPFFDRDSNLFIFTNDAQFAEGRPNNGNNEVNFSSCSFFFVGCWLIHLRSSFHKNNTIHIVFKFKY